jgi:hypothetical protein
MTKLLPAIIPIFWLIGCGTPEPMVTIPLPDNYGSISDFGAAERRPAAAAPDWMVTRARRIHTSSGKAKRFPYFEFCQRRLEGPGYEAKFTKAPGDRRNITYYFDDQGNYIRRSGIAHTE